MKQAIIYTAIVGLLIGGTFAVLSKNKTGEGPASPATNVTIEEGVQIIDIQAKGGYSPKRTVAKAGVPTVIRMNTSGTFDCSSAFMVPALDYRANLPATGVTEIEVPAQAAGTTLEALCSMGMYTMSISFE